jgi:hypothetical protein
MCTVISDRLAMELGLKIAGLTTVYTAAGRVPVRICNIDISLPGGINFFDWPVNSGGLPPEIELLIGVDIMSFGDFAFSHPNGRTQFTFQLPSTHATDYLVELMVNG